MIYKNGLLAAAVALFPMSAQAVTLSAPEILQQYNVITRGDFINRSDDIEGNAFIGGNLTSGNQFEFGAQDTSPRSDVAELVILGDVDSSVGLIRGGNAQRDVFIAGSSNAGLQNSAVLTTDASLVPENVFDTLDALSTQLAGLEANSVAGVGTNRLTLDASGTTSGIAIFDLTIADLNLGEVDTILGDAELVVINVFGDGAIATNFLGNSLPFGQKTIWNFTDAEDLVFERTFVGQILAGGATVENRGNIEGTLFAETFVQGSEAHLNRFTGELPEVTAVPLPAGGVLLLGGLAFFAGMRRRK
ncbi:MAG: choice-of-anchor A family protein [Roseobacter sp.]